MSEAKTEKRAAIIGTAPSYRLTPWDDPTLECWTLNDEWIIPIPRSDRHFDLHPFEQFYFRDPKQRVLQAVDVPAGTYVRPVGHIEWLAQQSIPVYIQKPDPRVPRGVVFPRAEVEAFIRGLAKGQEADEDWYDSTPAWMLALAMYEGYTEIDIYGIHLATEWEYQKQKANMTYLIGLARGMGITVKVPKASPLLRPTHRYAFEPDPATPVTQAQRDLQKVQAQYQAVSTKAAQVPWWKPGARREAQEQVVRVKAAVMDAQLAVDWAMARKRAMSPV